MQISDIKQTGSVNSKIFKALREFGYSKIKFDEVEESVKAVIEGTDSNTNVIHVIIRKTLQEVCDIANDPTLR